MIFNCVENEKQRIQTALEHHCEREIIRNEVITHHEEFVRHSDLFDKIARDEDLCMDWLIKNDFIAKAGTPCPKCAARGRNGVMRFYKLKSYTQRRKCNVIYTCTGERSRCQYRVSPFKNTFFDGHFSKIPLGKVLQVIL